ncbi:MAG TPA: hypothetical protein VEH76_15175 [Methylocystis sp.]|nr:hypothetical protein [Methylocystis sp.]
MRALLFCVATASLALPTLALAQAPPQPPPQDQPPARSAPKERYYGSVRCQELREACLHKFELGEQGEGNCKWFRDNCR